MEKFGTDAVRFTLAQLAVQGRDLVLSDERLAASRAFANKIWNAARFVLMNLEGSPQPIEQVAVSHLSLADRWILNRLEMAIEAVSSAIDAYEFNVAALAVYQFIWHEFCDWYIELSKEPLKSADREQAAARYALVHCLDQLLRLLHPFMPFISEEIWQALRPFLNRAKLSDHLAVAEWPITSGQQLLSGTEAIVMERCIATTQAINSLRSIVGHHPGRRIKAVLKPTADVSPDIDSWKSYAATLAKLSELTVDSAARDRAECLAFAPLTHWSIASGLPVSVTWGEVGIETPSDFDFQRTRSMLQKKLDEVRAHLQRNENRYNNPAFREKAGEETVNEIADRIEQLKAQESLLQSQIGLIQ